MIDYYLYVIFSIHPHLTVHRWLDNRHAGYSPTRYQKSLFPAEYQPKFDVIFDGINSEIIHRRANASRRVRSMEIPEGRVPTETLVDLPSLRDPHIYLTVLFVLSWSLINALACGCVVLASQTEPVREAIVDGETGLLAGLFDVKAFARRAVDVLRDPRAYREVRNRAATMIEN